MKNFFKHAYYVGLGTALFVVVSGLLLAWNIGRVQAYATKPNANLALQQTIGSMGKFGRGGSVELPPEAAAQFGVNSLEWQAGQKPAEVLPTTLWDKAFGVGKLTPQQLVPGVNLDNAALSEYKFLEKVSIRDLVKAIPTLANLKIDDVPAIANLVFKSNENGLPLPKLPGGGAVQTIGQLANSKNWQNIPLGSNGNNIGNLAAGSIPGLNNTPLGKFDPKILSLPAIKFPGLSNLPLAQMPGFNIPAGYQVGFFDRIYTNEKVMRKVVSGSRETPNAKCTNPKCGHIELQGPGLVAGSQIVAGDTQRVEAGYGFMKAIASTEPAGIDPFGETIHETVEQLNAAKGTGVRNWYFNICSHGFIDLGCSAHFIGPIPSPFGTIKEGDRSLFLLGNISIPVTVKNPITNPGLPAGLPGAGKSPATSGAVGGAVGGGSGVTGGVTKLVAPQRTTLDLPQLNDALARVLPQLSPNDIVSKTATLAAGNDPATGKSYTPDKLVETALTQLVAGNDADFSKDTLSLEMELTLGELLDKVKAIYAAS